MHDYPNCAIPLLCFYRPSWIFSELGRSNMVVGPVLPFGGWVSLPDQQGRQLRAEDPPQSGQSRRISSKTR